MRSVGEILQAGRATRQETCAEHGAYVAHSAFRGFWTGCPVCAARQAADEAAGYARTLRREARRRETEARIGRAGIVPRFAGCRIENFEIGGDEKTQMRMRRAKAFAQDFADNFPEVLATGRSAIFAGGMGTGKNHLACGIAHAVLEQGYSVVVITVAELMQRVKESFNGGSEVAAMRPFVQADLLVLDEFGAGNPTETESRLLGLLVNARYEAVRPTLVLTNLTGEDWQRRVEARRPRCGLHSGRRGIGRGSTRTTGERAGQRLQRH